MSELKIEVTERIERHGRVTYFDVNDGDVHLLRVWTDQLEGENRPLIHIAHSFNDDIETVKMYVEALNRAIQTAEKWNAEDNS